MNTFSTISRRPSKVKGLFLALIKKKNNPFTNKKLNIRFKKRVTNPSKRSNNYLVILLKTMKT
jgi:hypothetical protein